MAEIKVDETVDITDKVCPLTFVKAKVTLKNGNSKTIKMTIKVK